MCNGSETSAQIKPTAMGYFEKPAGVRVAPYICDASEAHEIAKKHFHPGESSCPGDSWWVTARPVAFSCRPLTIVNIGANKGYYVAFFLSMLAPSLNIHPSSIFPLIQSVTGLDSGCGVCDDCKLGAFISGSSNFCTTGDGRVVKSEDFGLDIHAIEPVDANIDLLKLGVETLVKRSDSKTVRVHLHKAAVQGDPLLESVPFNLCSAGTEVCGILLENRATKREEMQIDVVPAITVDTMNEKLGTDINVIDFLAIDAEGTDPDIIDGAEQMIKSGHVRLLEFEYNSMRKWESISLESIINKLDGWGFECFQMQKDTLVRLTRCWDPAYETKRWSNVLCVHTSDETMLHALSGYIPRV